MQLDRKGFYELTQSLSLYHRITSEKYTADFEYTSNTSILEKLYVDLLPSDGILGKMLERRTTFLAGRKGTGKSTIFSRTQHEIHKLKKDISVYINAKSVYKNCESNNVSTDFLDIANKFSDNEMLKLTLLKKLIDSLSKSLTEELSKEEYGIFERITNKFIRNARLESAISDLNKLANESKFVNANKVIIDESARANLEEFTTGVKVAIKDATLEGGVQYKESSSKENKNINILARVFNIGEIVEKILEILKICNRESIYIFIDDYSELSRSERSIFMETIISPMYHLGVDKIHFKIACYPNRIDPIKLDSGKFSIKSIDLYDVYGRDNNIPDTEKLAIDYMRRLLENRCNIYCKSNIQDYFDTKSASMEEYYKLLFQVSMNVPRVLGHVLNECYLKNTVYDKAININSIKESSKQYYYNHVQIYFNKQTTVKYNSEDVKLDIFVQENLKNALVYTAQKNKYELIKQSNSYFEGLTEVPTSHFTIPPACEQYLEELELNGFVHKLNKLASKGRGKDIYKNETNYLYALDYGLCVDEKIIYSKPENVGTKYYQQRVFVYDDVILTTLKNNKKITCKNCGASFSIDELEMFERFRMKCSECPNGICEIEFDRDLMKKVTDSINNAIWTEHEFDILYAIKLLTESNGNVRITANLISGEIDYTSQFIAWRCKDLEKSGYVDRNMSFSPYTYSLTERAIGILNSINKS